MGFGRAPIPGCCEVGGCIVDGSSSCAILRHVNVRVVNDVAIAASDDAAAAGTLGTRQLFRAKWLSACVVTQSQHITTLTSLSRLLRRTLAALWYSFARHVPSSPSPPPSLCCIIGCYLFIACKSTDFGTRARHFHIKPGTRWCFIHKYWHDVPAPCMLMWHGTRHYANKASHRLTCKLVIRRRHDCILLCWLHQLAFLCIFLQTSP